MDALCGVFFGMVIAWRWDAIFRITLLISAAPCQCSPLQRGAYLPIAL